MKKIYFLIVFFYSFFLYSDISVDSLFTSANKLYKQKEFQQAIDDYLLILNQDISNQILFYNIGNAYYRMNKLGYARLYYEKAKIAKPKNVVVSNDINHNISFLETQLVDTVVPLKELFVVTYIKKIKSLLSNNQWGFVILSLLYLNLFFILLLSFNLSPKIKQNSLRALFLFAPIFLCIFLLFVLPFNNDNSDFAILVSPNTYVKTAPSQSSVDQFVIHEGLKFKIVDEVDGWSRVVLQDGKDGWISNQHFVKIH